MSTATIVIEGDSPRILHPLTGDDSASKRLKECARILREHVKRHVGLFRERLATVDQRLDTVLAE